MVNINSRKITVSALVIALYLVIMYFTQGFSFGQYQIRLATSLYSLAYMFPFLVVPLAIANGLSNLLMGGLGLVDVIGGFVVGFVVAKIISVMGIKSIKPKLIVFPILSIGLIVPIWLSYILQINYWLLVVNISIGQIIPSILGVVIIENLLRKQLPLRNYDFKKK